MVLFRFCGPSDSQECLSLLSHRFHEIANHAVVPYFKDDDLVARLALRVELDDLTRFGVLRLERPGDGRA